MQRIAALSCPCAALLFPSRRLHSFGLAGCLRLVAAVLLGITTTGAATLPPVKLAWNANPERNIAGYEVRYGTTPGVHTKVVAAGTKTTVAVSGLKDGTDYYFVVYARNKAGRISARSAEVSYRVDPPPAKFPQSAISLPAKFTTTVTVGSRIRFTGKGSDPEGKTPLKYRWNFGEGSGIPASSARNPGLRQFNIPGTYTVSMAVTNSAGQTDPTPARRVIIVKPPAHRLLARKGWKLKWVNSQDIAANPARNAFDDNPRTFWHTEWGKPNLPPPPHEIQIDLGAARYINGFQYLPRQDGFIVGNVGKYKFHVSMDGKKWGAPVATGAFVNSQAMKKVFFKKKRGRYIKLISVTEANGNKDCAVAELYVLQALQSAVKKSTAIPARNESTLATRFAAAYSTAAGDDDGLAEPGIAPRTAVEVIHGEKYLSLTVGKHAARDARARIVEVSPDLLGWFSGRKHTTVMIDNDEILKVRDNLPMSRTSRRFIRLKPVPR